MLSCRKQLSLKRNLFTVHVSSLEWDCILECCKCLTLPHRRHRRCPHAPPLHVSHLTSSLFLPAVSAPDPAGLRREPRAWHHRRTPTSCPTQSPASCPLAWSRPQVRFGLYQSVTVAKALIHSVWLSSLSTHTCTPTPHPTGGIPAACPRNGNQSKVTHAPNHQTPAARSFTKNRSSAARAPGNQAGGE